MSVRTFTSKVQHLVWQPHILPRPWGRKRDERACGPAPFRLLRPLRHQEDSRAGCGARALGSETSLPALQAPDGHPRPEVRADPSQGEQWGLKGDGATVFVTVRLRRHLLWG